MGLSHRGGGKQSWPANSEAGSIPEGSITPDKFAGSVDVYVYDIASDALVPYDAAVAGSLALPGDYNRYLINASVSIAR
jgi:hypothetical protein